MAYQKIITLLQEQRIPFNLHAHAAVRTIADATEKAPLLVERLIKTVVFKIKDGAWILAAVPSAARIDYRKLAAALGVNRRDVRSVAPADVEAELGFEIGGVGPIPLRDDVRALFDRSLLAFEFVRFGSGKNTQTVEMRLTDLLAVTHGQLVSITQEDSPDESH